MLTDTEQMIIVVDFNQSHKHPPVNSFWLIREQAQQSQLVTRALQAGRTTVDLALVASLWTSQHARAC